MKTVLKVRMGINYANNGSTLIDGNKIIKLFSDIATELLIRHDGDEGFIESYDNIEFIEPIYVGDYIEVKGELIGFGNISRKILFEVKKIITSRYDINDSACDVLVNPIMICTASATCIVPKQRQRR